MTDYDGGFKIVARHSGRQLSEVAGVPCEEWEPIGDTLQTTERLADRAFRARRGGERFVVYLEAYTEWEKDAPWNMLAKSGLLSERERLPRLSLLFVLRRRRYKAMQGQFRLAVSGAPTQQIWFREICLWEQEPQPWWEDWPGLMALYPLCRHGRPRATAVVHAAQKITERATDTIARADLLTTLCIFGKLAYRELDVLQLIGREQMRESKFFQEILEEGRVEGVLERARADVHEIIALRFGEAAAARFQATLRRIADPERLSHLLRLAIQCDDLAELRRAFRANGPAH